MNFFFKFSFLTYFCNLFAYIWEKLILIFRPVRHISRYYPIQIHEPISSENKFFFKVLELL